MSQSTYETLTALEQYLLFHYGTADDLMPFPFGPKNSLHFPVRCITECLDLHSLPNNARALDLGCAVGRSSFELAKHCKQVIGIDRSQAFINAAKQIQEFGELEYTIREEGAQTATRFAIRPENVDSNRIEFKCDCVMNYLNTSEQFDVVLVANLICRLADPISFLKRLHRLVKPEGQLILTSPYSWLEEHTPKSSWLTTKPLDQIKEYLSPHFILKNSFDMPFLIREHLRKYQWVVAEASIWKRIA